MKYAIMNIRLKRLRLHPRSSYRRGQERNLSFALPRRARANCCFLVIVASQRLQTAKKSKEALSGELSRL